MIFIPTCACVLFDFSVKLQLKTSSVSTKLNSFLMSLMSLSVSNVINYDSQYANARSVYHIQDTFFVPHTNPHTQWCGLTSFTLLYASRSQSHSVAALPCSLEITQRFWTTTSQHGLDRTCRQTARRTELRIHTYKHTKKAFVCAGDSLVSDIKERCGRRDRQEVKR